MNDNVIVVEEDPAAFGLTFAVAELVAGFVHLEFTFVGEGADLSGGRTVADNEIRSKSCYFVDLYYFDIDCAFGIKGIDSLFDHFFNHFIRSFRLLYNCTSQ